MKILTLPETANYLEAATIENTTDYGFAIVHIGMTLAGCRFVMINNYKGETFVTEAD